MSVRIVPAEGGLTEAVARLQSGGLVAFPTETVYGLGANALDSDAVARIFAAKGRPSTNPLIVHVADRTAAHRLVTDWPERATTLADAFWPGPLTLVLPRTDAIPPIVTGGGPTVGLRVPNHPVALALLQRSGLPIAAPSANRSEEISPTTAQHVADSLGPYVDDLLILDGGPCAVGLESTVLDVTTTPFRILRPGMLTAAQLGILSPDTPDTAVGSATVARSPGQMLRHYAPHRPVLLTTVPQEVLSSGDGFLACGDESDALPGVTVVRLPAVADAYAAGLYAALRTLDRSEVRRIVIQLPPNGASWTAIHDRLRRAAAPKEAQP